MALGLTDNVLEYPLGSPHKKIYTTNEQLNEWMNSFVSEAEEDNVWVSVEMVETPEFRDEVEFEKMLQLSMDTAKANCIETTLPKNRFVKVRCRDVQHQILIKISYSCENQRIRYFDKDLAKVQRIVERVGGYMGLQLDKDVGVIKIAIPHEVTSLDPEQGRMKGEQE